MFQFFALPAHGEEPMAVPKWLYDKLRCPSYVASRRQSSSRQRSRGEPGDEHHRSPRRCNGTSDEQADTNLTSNKERLSRLIKHHRILVAKALPGTPVAEHVAADLLIGGPHLGQGQIPQPRPDSPPELTPEAQEAIQKIEEFVGKMCSEDWQEADALRIIEQRNNSNNLEACKAQVSTPKYLKSTDVGRSSIRSIKPVKPWNDGAVDFQDLSFVDANVDAAIAEGSLSCRGPERSDGVSSDRVVVIQAPRESMPTPFWSACCRALPSNPISTIAAPAPQHRPHRPTFGRSGPSTKVSL
jgi:hypothetical protein